MDSPDYKVTNNSFKLAKKLNDEIRPTALRRGNMRRTGLV